MELDDALQLVRSAVEGTGCPCVLASCRIFFYLVTPARHRSRAAGEEQVKYDAHSTIAVSDIDGRGGNKMRVAMRTYRAFASWSNSLTLATDRHSNAQALALLLRACSLQ